MDLSRRAALTSSVIMGSLLAGCQSDNSKNGFNGEKSSAFDDRGNLTAPVDNRFVQTETAWVTKDTTVYVRENGDDSNDGLSPDSPKATVQNAINDAPISGPNSLLRIDIGKGTFEGFAVTEQSGQIPLVELIGKVDDDGNHLTTLSGSTEDHTIHIIQGAFVVLTDLEIAGGDEGCIEVRNNSTARAKNCYVHGGPEHSVRVSWNGYYRDDRDTILDQSAVDGNGANLKVTAGAADLKGTYIGDGGTNSVIRVKENGYAMIAGCTVIGEGNDPSTGTSHGVRCFHNSAVKISEVTIEDCYIALNREMAGWIKVQNGIEYNNCKYEIIGEGGYHRDFLQEDEEVYSLPRNDTTPSNHWSRGPHRGAMHYNNSTDRVEVSTGGDTLELGRKVVEAGSRTVPAGSTITFDVTSSKGTPLHVAWNLDKTVESDVHVTQEIRYEDEKVVVCFQETLGTNDADIIYKMCEI